MSIIRKRSAAHKSYIPSNARDNQYILAEFNITEQLLQRFSANPDTTTLTPTTASKSPKNYLQFYQTLSNMLFDLSEVFELENCQFIANDKLARVRFNQEVHQWQTKQQILFYYNPENHQFKKSFFNANKRAQKISLLFLPSGINIRENAADFHAKTTQFICAYAKKIALNLTDIRVRDHQHLTYDLFAKSKVTNCDNNLSTQGHKLRPIIRRYASQRVTLPKSHNAMTYAIVNLPISNQLVSSVELDHNAADPYNPLYTYLADTFTQAAKHYNLNNGALIANGLVPIVRHSTHEEISRMGELQMLGYNPQLNPCGIVCKWDANTLVDNVKLIFVATDKNQTENGYGRFLNQIERAITLLTSELGIEPTREEVIVRFHQHVAYNL